MLSSLSNNSRKVVQGDNTEKYFVQKINDIVYIIITNLDYQERLSAMLVKEINSLFTIYQNDNNKSSFVSNSKQLLKKYNNPESFDNLTKANDNLEDIKLIMKDNLNNILNNHNNLDDLEKGTEGLSKNADKFRNSSKNLERIMRWRNIKLMIYAILLLVCLVGFIVLMVVT